jgi:hypothetical protein
VYRRRPFFVYKRHSLNSEWFEIVQPVNDYLSYRSVIFYTGWGKRKSFLLKGDLVITKEDVPEYLIEQALKEFWKDKIVLGVSE